MQKNRSIVLWFAIKLSKTHLGPFWGLFTPQTPKQEFSQNIFTHFLAFMLLYIHAKNKNFNASICHKTLKTSWKKWFESIWGFYNTATSCKSKISLIDFSLSLKNFMLGPLQVRFGPKTFKQNFPSKKSFKLILSCCTTVTSCKNQKSSDCEFSATFEKPHFEAI